MKLKPVYLHVYYNRYSQRHLCVKQICALRVLLPTDAQEKFFNRSIKIYMKTAPTCFGVITIIRESTM